jgi:hypothetical protein
MRTPKSNRKTPVREYDFSKGARGKYAARAAGSNVVILAPDVAKTFRDSKSVNAALRAVQGMARLTRLPKVAR